MGTSILGLWGEIPSCLPLPSLLLPWSALLKLAVKSHHRKDKQTHCPLPLSAHIKAQVPQVCWLEQKLCATGSREHPLSGHLIPVCAGTAWTQLEVVHVDNIYTMEIGRRSRWGSGVVLPPTPPCG